MSDETKWWDEYNETGEEESPAGKGGVVCKVSVRPGFKVFASGFRGEDQEKTFFLAPPGSDNVNERNAAKDEANKFARENGNPNVQFGIMLRRYREGAVKAKDGSPIGWNSDQFDWFGYYTDASKETLVPSLRDCGINLKLAKWNWQGWARVSWTNDPYCVKNDIKKRETDQVDADGNPVFDYELVPFLAEVFESQKKAYEYVEQAAAEKSFPETPDGFDAESWNEMKVSIRDALAKQRDDDVAKMIAAHAIKQDYGLDMHYIQPIADEVYEEIPY